MKNTSLLCPWTRRHREVKKASRVVPPAVPTNTPSTVAKIVTTDHASTLFEMQQRLVPQGRPGPSLACSVSQGSVSPPPPTTLTLTLSHPQATPPSRCSLHEGHDQLFTCPDAQRLEAASCLLRTISYRSRPSTPRRHSLLNNTAPVLAPEMRRA